MKDSQDESSVNKRLTDKPSQLHTLHHASKGEVDDGLKKPRLKFGGQKKKKVAWQNKESCAEETTC